MSLTRSSITRPNWGQPFASASDFSYKTSNLSDPMTTAAHRTYKRSLGDRFIPNRKASLEFGQANLTINKRGLTEYQRALMDVANPHPDHHKILYYSENPKPEPYYCFHSRQFIIPGGPSQILAAPGFVNNFYFNNLSVTKEGQLVAISLNGITCFYDYGQDTILGQISQATALQTATVWRPSHFQILLADLRPVLALVDIGVMQQNVYQFPAAEISLISADWKDNNCFTMGGGDGGVYVYDARQPNIVNSFTADLNALVCGMKWSNDHELLAVGTNAKNVKVYDPRDYSRPIYQRAHLAGVKALCWSPEGHSSLFSGGGNADRRIFWHDLYKKEVRAEMPTGSQVCQVECLDDGYLVSSHGHGGKKVVLWEMSGDGCAFREKALLSGLKGRVLSLGCMENLEGFTICGVSDDEMLSFWDLRYKKKHEPRLLNRNVSILQMPQIR